jgi:hypothetical protein
MAEREGFEPTVRLALSITRDQQGWYGRTAPPGEHRAFSMLAYVWRGTRDAETKRLDFTPETASPERNERDQSPTKIQQNQRAGLYPPAHNGLVAGSSPAGPAVKSAGC